MTEREISVECLARWAMWLMALALVGVGWLLQNTHPANLGIVIAAAAATLTVRGYFVRMSRTIRAISRQASSDVGPAPTPLHR